MSAQAATLAVAAFCTAVTALGDEPFFMGVGDLPGGSFLSTGAAVSADGQVVVGQSISEGWNVFEAYRWDAENGMVGLGGPQSSANGVSADGSFVVGGMRPVPYREAYRWTEDEGKVGLGDLPGGAFYSEASDVSADGSAVVGISCSAESGEAWEGFRWTPDQGMVGLGDLPGGTYYSVASGVSADGALVVGYSSATSGKVAFYWTVEGGMVPVALDPDWRSSEALDVSADGSVIVGRGFRGRLYEAFRWTEDEGMVGLGDLPGGDLQSGAWGVSADGSVVVGQGWSDAAQEAFIWDSVNGMRALQGVLVDEFGLDLTGWTLRYAVDLSDDGLTIVGTGRNPDGNSEGWIAHLPEPGTLAPLVLGGGLMARRRWQSR